MSADLQRNNPVRWNIQAHGANDAFAQSHERREEGIVTVTIEELRMDQGVEPHAAATASCQRAVASARKALSVDREMRWR